METETLTGETSQPTTKKRRSGKKRLILAAGATLSAAALITAAAFTDQGFLNFGGTGGFAGYETRYNLQFSAGNEKTAPVLTSPSWIEAAGPAGADITIAGSEQFIPGSAPIYVSIPVKNDSPNYGSTLSLVLQNKTVSLDPNTGENLTRNTANNEYIKMLRFRVLTTTNSTAVDANTPGWSGLMSFNAGTPAVLPTVTGSEDLPDMDANETTVVVVEVSFDPAADQDDYNLANGGGSQVTANLSGESMVTP